MFVVGAYQEILGNHHNLFGNTNIVHVKATATGYQVERLLPGDTVESVLLGVQYSGNELLTTMQNKVQTALCQQTITPESAKSLLENYRSVLNNSTYLKR